MAFLALTGTMLHAHIICIVLSAMFVVTCLTEDLVEELSIGDVHSDGRILTECDIVRRVSLVCYQCAKRHVADFLHVYVSCCANSTNEFRIYCEATFTEPPTRGG